MKITDRSYRVVNPNTGEVAAEMGGTDFSIAIALCNKLAEETKSLWQVQETRVIYSRDPGGSGHHAPK